MHRKGEAKEAVAMGWAAAEAEYYSEWAKDSSKTKADVITEEKLQSYINNSAGGEVATVTANNDGTYRVTYQPDGEDNKIFIVHDNGQIDTFEITEEEKNDLLEELLGYANPNVNQSYALSHYGCGVRSFTQVGELFEKVKYYNFVCNPNEIFTIKLVNPSHIDIAEANSEISTDEDLDIVLGKLENAPGTGFGNGGATGKYLYFRISTNSQKPNSVLLNCEPINPLYQP